MATFAPYGASIVIDVTQVTQAIALPAMPSTGVAAISLMARSSQVGSLFVKLGTVGVTVSITDGMVIHAGQPNNPSILAVSNSETHLAILCDGTPGKVILTAGSLFDDENIAPFGASTSIAVTQVTQTVALPTMPSIGTPGIILVARSSQIGSLFIKLGGAGVTVATTDGMAIHAGRSLNPTVIAVSSSETHIAILCDGVPGNVTLTVAALLSGSTTTSIPIGSVTGLGTSVRTALTVNVGTDGAFVVKGGALGSPSSAGTMPAFTLGGTVSGGGQQLNNVIIGTVTPLAGSFTTVAASTSATITTSSAVGALGVVKTGATQVDGAAWGQAFTRLGANFSAAGSGASGSANENGLSIQVNITATSSAANYEKVAALFMARTADPSSGGVTRDAVGADTRGYIASTNATGRAWGGTDWALIEAGGDGLLVGREIDIYNNGTDQANVDQTTSKYGLQLIAYGTADSTAAIQARTGTQKWHKVLYSTASDISTGGNFLELLNKFVVDASGQASIGLNAATGPLTVSSNTAAGGTSITGTIAHLIGADSTAVVELIDGFAGTPTLTGRRSAGTLASKTATANNNSLLTLAGRGYETGTPAYSAGDRARINMYAGEAFTASAQGAGIIFSATPTGGTTLTEAMRIFPSAGVRVGPAGDPGLNGFAVVNALATAASFTSTASGANVIGFGSTPTTGAVNDGIGINCTLANASGGQFQAALFRAILGTATAGAEDVFWQVYNRKAGSLQEVLRLHASGGASFGSANVGTDPGDGIVYATGYKAAGATAGIGYATGAGGTVTQLTNKSTGVTLNTVCGAITMNNAALAAGAEVTFTLTNSAIAATDIVFVVHSSAGTAGSYMAQANTMAAGSCGITVTNLSAGSFSEAIVLTFIVLKAVTA